MSAATVADRVRAVIAKEFDRRAEIPDAASLRHDLGLDSLDEAELVMALEVEFEGVQISDETLNRWRCVGDVVATVERLAAVRVS